MIIEYDEGKNQRNIYERALNFEDARRFDFSTAVIEADLRRPYPETRYVALGYLCERLHVLCFSPIRGGIRVISFRKANTREVKNYERTRTTH